MHCLLHSIHRSKIYIYIYDIVARIQERETHTRIIYRVSRAENESKASLNHVLDDLYRLSLEIVLLLPLLPPSLPFVSLSVVGGWIDEFPGVQLARCACQTERDDSRGP